MRTPTYSIPKETDRDSGLFSKAIKAGRRTYFFDVKTTKNDDHYIVITESRRKPESENGGVYEKQKLFLYKEDFNKFLTCLQDSLNFIETRNPVTTQVPEIDDFVMEPAINMELEKEFEML